MRLFPRVMAVAFCILSLAVVQVAAAPAKHPTEVAIAQLIANLSTMNIHDYRFAMSSLAPSVKAKLWRQHLMSELATRKLTREQRAVITDALEFLSAKMFATPKNTAEWKDLYAPPLGELRSRAEALFEPEARAAVFFRVVAERPMPHSVMEVSNRQLSGLEVLPAVAHGPLHPEFGLVQAGPACYCFFNPYEPEDDPTCFAYTFCVPDGRCTPSEQGCGFFEEYPCNGICCNPHTQNCSF